MGTVNIIVSDTPVGDPTIIFSEVRDQFVIVFPNLGQRNMHRLPTCVLAAIPR